MKRYFDFILSSVLHNTFKIYEYINSSSSDISGGDEEREHGKDHEFSTFCVLLAEELFDSSFLY